MRRNLPAVLARGRAMAEERMRETWTIGTDGGWAYDKDAGRDVQTFTPLFATPARLKPTGNVVLRDESGEHTGVETRRELHIPVGAAEVPVNALARCDVLDPQTSDPSLRVGTLVRLTGPAPGSQTTARRLEVIEVLA